MINGIPSPTLLPTLGAILTCYRETSIFLPFPLFPFSSLRVSMSKYNQRKTESRLKLIFQVDKGDKLQNMEAPEILTGMCL